MLKKELRYSYQYITGSFCRAVLSFNNTAMHHKNKTRTIYSSNEIQWCSPPYFTILILPSPRNIKGDLIYHLSCQLQNLCLFLYMAENLKWHDCTIILQININDMKLNDNNLIYIEQLLVFQSKKHRKIRFSALNTAGKNKLQ